MYNQLTNTGVFMYINDDFTSNSIMYVNISLICIVKWLFIVVLIKYFFYIMEFLLLVK